MTVVRPNSIAGINSITVQTGQALNIHDANGNLIRNITSSSGVSTFSSLHVGSGTTTSTQGISVGTGCSIISTTVNTLEFYTNSSERLRIQADGGVAVGTNAVSAGDLATGTTIGNPKLHVDCGHLGNGAYHIARFRAGGDNDNNAAVLTLNHSNDRGLALYGGRSSGDRSWIALKSIDSAGRVSNAIEIIGDEGQGVQDLKFYTGDATTTTERLRIGPVGIITHTFVSDNSTTAEGFYINNTQNTTGNNASLVFSNDSGNRKKAAVSLIDTGNYGAGDLVFALDGADSGALHLTNDEKVRITKGGLVGIGTDTSASSCKLQLVEPDSTEVFMQVANQTTGYDANSGLLIGYNGSEVAKFMNMENTAMDIGTNGNSRIAIANDGHIVVSNSIAFAGETATANRLSDYEEGTWTPEVRIETRAASDSPIDGVEGCYTKVGKLVTCHGKFVLNGTPSERSTSRAIELRGFPFDHNHDWDKVSGDIRVTGHDIASTYGEDIYFVIRMLSGQQYARIELVEQSYNGTRNASVVMQDEMQVLFTFTYVTV